MSDCGIVRNTNMYEQFAKEFHVALREISKQLIAGVLILPPAVTISLGALLCVLVALLGVPLTESLPDFIGAVAGPVAFMQIYFLLAAGFVIYLCFVVYQNWAGMKMPPIAIRLFFKILKSAGYWISQVLGPTRVVQSPNLTSCWFAYPERVANHGTRYLPGDSPQLE